MRVLLPILEILITKGLEKFKNVDIKLEIDRFHLNNSVLQSELENTAKKILIA